MNPFLHRLFAPRPSASPWDSDDIIRDELFSIERLEQHAASLAQAQAITRNPVARRPLNKRLSDNEAVLLDAYRSMAVAVGEGETITPAAEWLLDNYHVVEAQVRQIHDDLPPRFYRQLPKLAGGPLAGYPRVFGMAWACVAHSDSRFDPEMLRRFVRAYQTVQPLTIGELWAIAITLRIVLVENLRRAADRILGSRAARREGDEIADRLLGVNGRTAEPQALVRRYAEDPDLPESFVAQMVKRLRDQDPRVTPALVWLENQLSAQGTTSEAMVRDDHQRQGAANVTVRNIITSMRLISDMDWASFFEDVSLVDEVLRSAGTFARMDFATRNLYRSAIEELARGSVHTELEIAQSVVEAATAAVHERSGRPADCTHDARARDPGYHLLAGGRADFERAIGYRPPPRQWLSRFNTAIGPSGYIAAVLLLSAALLAGALWMLHGYAIAVPTLALLAVLGWVPAVDLGVALVNRAATRVFGPTMLPGLAMREGVPSNARTMVVVPTLLARADAIEEQIERLQVHCLSSLHGEVYFALLSDWTDAATQEAEGDRALLQVAIDGIARLNRLHGSAEEGERFYLLHRHRVWSDSEQTWMGWERKRGKLHELNRLLRGAADTTFVSIEGQRAVPSGVRYVVTLDADTRLPRETLRRLVGKLAHPLNRPRYDAATGRVVEGYAVLQPRVTLSLPVGNEGSLFQRVFSSMTGIDAYDAVVSDVYQDLFGEGSYAGKGIYDIDAFEAALAGRVPDGSMLSHDLFEGTFARAGLVSDIEVVEEFPSRYDVAAARNHRWARGDWQLLPWIFGRRDMARRGNDSLPLIARWKMLDNLRRSLSAPAMLVALVAGWLLPANAALLWTGFILSVIAVPALLPVLAGMLPQRRGVIARSHLRALGNDLRIALLQIVLTIVFLAHQASLMADAIGRTLFRLFVSKRNLLEWVTAAQAERRERGSVIDAYRRKIASMLIALTATAVAIAFGGEAKWLVIPLAIAWLAAPAIARAISISPPVGGRLSVSETDALSLRLIARRTWRYFETFVTADDHMLPPDNFQEDPKPVLARRTSPTNIGLYLLCIVSARDFGWLGTNESADRVQATLDTMRGMERFRGHFYNWYDTGDLRPLEPRYVSSVDSGNLAGHLIALANACREWIHVPVTHAASMAGVDDAMHFTREALRALPKDRRAHTITRQELMELFNELATALREDTDTSVEPAVRLSNLIEHATTFADTVRALASEQTDDAYDDMLFWAEAIWNSLASWHRDVMQTDAERHALEARLLELEATARSMAFEMEFDFLLDPERKLLSIGYLAAEGTLDSSCYDLLASEARLASLFAVAKNDVPTRHWFRLGREVTPIGHGAALISWSGSMFEYLMPSLVMRAPTGSLLEQTNRLIVKRQIAYGHSLGVPWGVSESAYSARDLELTYQYSNFGVPGLGLKRGLSENVVIAPYAAGLAAMIDPAAAVQNFTRLAEIGAFARFGFYEALDYTRSRLPEGTKVAIVRAFMAHHQGMTVTAIANVLFDGCLRTRFHAEASVQAAELLLQERTPRDVAIVHPRAEEVHRAPRVTDVSTRELRRLHTAHSASPQTHLLSNGRYAVMVTSAGSGYSRWADQGVTRWREDATRDDMGSYLFLRDVQTGAVWSAGYQPSGAEPDRYEVTFTEDHAEFIRSDGNVTTTMQVLVSPEDDAEVRRLSISNTGDDVREIDVTSYAELVLAPPAADTAHQAFSKLFVQTEYIAKLGLLLATRRRRSPSEPEMWAGHHVVVEGDVSGAQEFETDRARFLGRGREVHAPIAVMDGQPLSNTVGTVLDPVFALRQRMRIEPGATVRLSFWTGVSSSRASVMDLFDKHHDINAYDRATTLAWTQAQVQLRHMGISAEEATLFQRAAGHALYTDASMRPSSAAIQRGAGSRSALWAQGISGDRPIVLLKIEHLEDIDIVRQLLRAHEYWRLKQLAVDLVILNERASSYVQDLQVGLETAVRVSQSRVPLAADSQSALGSVFVLRTDLISPETRALLPAVACAVFMADRGSLADQLEGRSESASLELKTRRLARKARAPSTVVAARAPSATATPRDLEFFNGLGGFSEDGREYVIHLGVGQFTPAPWLNVIANPAFGFQVAAEGGGYTWAINSRENQLTQWSNDPVSDRPGEVLYVRDEDSGEIWGPTAAPIRDDAGPYRIRHGQGYSRFEHSTPDIALDLLMYVPMDDPIKICRLKIRNTSQRQRRLSVTAYVEWVLGTTRAASAPHLVTEIDAQTGAVFARNPWNGTFASRVAFADLAGRQTQWTGDRREFIGVHGRLDQPAALIGTEPLSGRVGAGLDPCAALQTSFALAPEETTEIVFFLGEAQSASEAQAVLDRYRRADLDAVLLEVEKHWDAVLGTIQVRTPDRSMDIMLNRWMLYQTLVCRVWARSAFYQASGAYGFRDQLQDGMALINSTPAITREHLLRAAGRQFPEGDVQHWWLPPTGQGVRTRISDDRIWLAYTAVHYLKTTGDLQILDEEVGFLKGRTLQIGEHDAYFQPDLADETATFFEHCARALDDSLELGAHGLPLIGTGDWNDGMNRVGEHGRGESVWLGWFLYTTLSAFAPVAQARNEPERARRWLDHAAALRVSLEREGWDGGWYRRGYFDDGTPFGSASSEECRIDSIAQSWSVISGAADANRRVKAMAAVEEHLIRRDDALAVLFTPPFDRTSLDPGYIKGYPPGLRENGGQYTHAAAWLIVAFAQLGEGEKAAELFSMLNQVNRTKTRTGIQRYKVEPYAVAADIYSVAPHVGRGGWTWYTGSAAWLYRAGLESILGFRREGDHLVLAPCIPKDWPRFEIDFKYGATHYEIEVENPHGVNRGIEETVLDGVSLPDASSRIPLVDDGGRHHVKIRLGQGTSDE